MKHTDNSSVRKYLQNYSYCQSSNIGKGYSSYVYKGRNDLTGETVAIKVIDIKMLKGQVHRNLLASEIESLQSLRRCRHIIDLHHIYSNKNNTHIITEFCQGGDLSKVISGKRGMPEAEAVQLLKQIVDGYSDIYSQRIIHRDLKPANILLKDGKVKIADFGFAMKSSDSKKYSSYNVGSPIYMPPEALNENKYTYKSDVWAIGVIFYQLLTGKAPWRAKTQKQLGRQLTSVPISRLLPKNISSTSSQFLQRALCVNFEKRMTPQQLQRYMDCFKGQNPTKNSFLPPRSESVHYRFEKTSSVHDQRQISLNKNTIYQPKNIKGLPFLKGNGGQQAKNGLPKTASTLNNAQITPISIDKKQISKELLSQIHFCRYVFKLLQRIDAKVEDIVSYELKENMCGIIFDKLKQIDNLALISEDKARQYKRSQEFQKIKQITNQYMSKYQKELNMINLSDNNFQGFEQKIKQQLKVIFQGIQCGELEEKKENVIILDYLITLKQLVHLIQKYDIEGFHVKSKIEAIVEGSPTTQITEDHIRGICSKLKAIKVL